MADGGEQVVPKAEEGPSVENLKLEDGAAGDDEDVVTPWDVSTNKATGVDYDKLIGTFLSIVIAKFAVL